MQIAIIGTVGPSILKKKIHCKKNKTVYDILSYFCLLVITRLSSEYSRKGIATDLNVRDKSCPAGILVLLRQLGYIILIRTFKSVKELKKRFMVFNMIQIYFFIIFTL